MDGLGGHPSEGGVYTELETAITPHLDSLAAGSICGLHQVIGPGITPGSGPGHLALFGYDPLRYEVGRGILAGLGIDFEFKAHDVAARGNFCTVDDAGVIVDRRAGRIPTETCAELCRKLSRITLPGVELFLAPVKDYRFLLVLRGDHLSEKVADTDPLQTGEKRLPPRALHPDAKLTADRVEQFLEEARKILADERPANSVLLRGFSLKPDIKGMKDSFGLKAAAVASYPMYRGLARLLGMEAPDCGESMDERIGVIEKRWRDFDFFFLHEKRTDSAGEDGDFEKKVACIEAVDSAIPRLMHLQPDVFVVTGDHSTPARLKSHSWHPVPVMLFSKMCRPDEVDKFCERACRSGYLGPRFPTTDLMPLVLANAMRLNKFGA